MGSGSVAKADSVGLRYLSVCSGIEAASVAWHGFGWEPVAFAEVAAFPSAVLAHRFPEVPNLGDLTKIDGASLKGRLDLIVGGTPCQAFSISGLRQSLSDARGNLTLKFVELCDAANPSLVLWENVPGVLNTPDNAFGCLLAGLAGWDEPLLPPEGRWPTAGVVRGPRRTLAWRVLDAQHFGVPQRRRRVFLFAARAGDGIDPAAVLFESQGLRGDPLAGIASWEGFAGRAGSGAAQQDVVCVTGERTHALTAEGADASEDGTGRGTPIICAAIAPTLPSRSTAGGGLGTDFDCDGGLVIEPQAVALVGREGGATAELRGSVYPTLRASTGGGDKPYILTDTVRRLIPKECERLQGFPDDWTRIPWRGKPAETCPDGPRYKACGNSMAVPVMRWIGLRISSALAITSLKRQAT